MKSHDEKVIAVEKALKAAHRKGLRYSVTSAWERRVMSHVAGLTALPLQNNTWDSPVVWRTVAAVSMSALIVLAYSFTANISPEYEAARLFLEDPLGVVFAQPLFP